MTSGIRRDQVRGLSQREEFTVLIDAALDAREPVATPVAIDPDDAGATGSGPLFAFEDHAHEWLTAAPSALTLTATASEGASTDGARADHVHSTAALPWGVVARQILTATSSNYSSSAAPGTVTDFALANVVVSVARLYRVTLHSQFSQSATGNWSQNFCVDGTAVGRFHVYNTGASLNSQTSASLLWTPATDTVDLDVRVSNISGGGTINFQADATAPRQFWVEDIGPRP